MDLIDRYLNAVRPLLPQAQREDIIAELTDALRSRVEDKESELGRPLKVEELEAILQDFGHPVVVAARYQPHQALIGPALYPLYFLALKWGVGLSVAITALRGMLRALNTPEYFSHIFNSVIGDAVSSGIFAIGLITLIFALIERSQPHLKPFAGWKPRNLPEHGYGWAAGRAASPSVGVRGGWSRKPRGPWEAGLSLVFTVAAGLWVAALGLYPELYPAEWRPQHWLDAAHVTAGPVWYPLLWSLLLASCVAQAVVYLIEMAQPRGVRLHAVGRLVCDAITIAGCVVAFTHGPLFTAGTGLSDTIYADGLENLDKVFRLMFAASALGAVFDGLWNSWKLVRGR